MSSRITGDPSHHLPLNLIPSSAIPPSPNVSRHTGSPTIDWLPDFAGYSWVAYGASSLLVISHFPSPLSPPQSHLRPLFRQILPLSSPTSADISAVSWSSSAHLAASIDRHIFVFNYLNSPGSFCWSQTAILAQSAYVEAISWTSSGDGIIAAGTDVVLWKRNIKSWQIAWKFQMKVPQTLISTTWSIEGPSATSAYPSELNTKEVASMAFTACKCVNLFYYDGKSGYVATELMHPQPVVTIQWRPFGGILANRNGPDAPRHVLLTSCVDGTARLWSEIDGSRIRKANKENLDPPTSKRSFCVVAVIELNQSLNGMVGTDIFLAWATDLEGAICVGERQLFSAERSKNNEVGRCEWLICFGPCNVLTFWAVHCLDDIATMQSPRVTLWKRQELLEGGLKNSLGSDCPRLISHYNKAFIWRNQHSGPPAMCSLVHLSAYYNLTCSVLYDQSLLKLDEEPSSTTDRSNKLSVHSKGILDTRGHTGKLLQVAVHPLVCDGQLAASLDSNGLITFWSISSGSHSILGLPSFSSSWQVIGKMLIQSTISDDMHLCWVPLSLHEERFLLVGHQQGIDVHIIKTYKSKEEEITCHKLCTIPSAGNDVSSGPDKIFSFPLDPTSTDSLDFMLLGIWMNKFQAKSWKLTLHCHESSGSCCECKCDTKSDCCTWAYQIDFAGKTYCLVVNLLSFYFPHGHDVVTSVSVVFPSLLMPSLQETLDAVREVLPNSYPYHLVTGHSDGSTRLWKITVSEASRLHTSFELVGMLSSYLGSVVAVAVADWGQKIATISSNGQENILCIWEPLHLAGIGTFVLEDKIYMDGEVLALHWFVTENMLFLGVCFQNVLHIYFRKVNSVQTLASEAPIWVCIASVCDSCFIRDFLVGPNGTIVVMHERYFTLFSQWSFLKSNKHIPYGFVTPYSTASVKKEVDGDCSTSCTDKYYICEELQLESTNGSMLCPPLVKTSCCVLEKGTLPCAISQDMGCYLKMTEVAEKLCGPLPFFHPDALLMNLYSGNWKRAYIAVCNLIECLASNAPSEKSPVPSKSSISVRQINLSSYLEGKSSDSRASQVFQCSKDIDTTPWSPNQAGLNQFAGHGTTNGIFTATSTVSKSYGFHDILENMHLPEAYSESQKAQMFAIVDLLVELNNSRSASAYESLDEPGRRFWCSIKLQQLEVRQKYSREPSVEELVVDSQLIGWAFHSDCHADLFDAILPTEPTWQEMRKIGVGFWFTNLTDMRAKMEKLARRQYLKNKDPKSCALLYVALNRLQVLAGLFKISKDEKDKPLVAFLSRNFEEEKNKAAALKNAYVLMGRHQFELAIAFFLLGGDITSAITVCAKNLGDGQLALVICRLAEGPGGPSERYLITKILLQSAIEKRDYWLASVFEWMLGNYLQSFLSVGFQGCSFATDPEKSEPAASADPHIGQYCQLLTAKNRLRNAIGEQDTAALLQWAVMMTASAFNKCGFPLEALEYLSPSASNLGVLAKGTMSGSSDFLPRILRPSATDSHRWLSDEVASCLVDQVKLDLAVQYISALFKEHPYWYSANFISSEAGVWSVEQEISQLGDLFKSFYQKLDSALAYLEQKFSLARNLLLNKVFVSMDYSKLVLIGYNLVQRSASRVHLTTQGHSSTQLLVHFVDISKNLIYSLARFVTAGSIHCSHILASSELSLADANHYGSFQNVEFYMMGFALSMGNMKNALMMFYNEDSKDLIDQLILTLDLCKYCLYFTSSMLQHNEQSLSTMFEPILALCVNGAYRELDGVSLHTILHQAVKTLRPTSSLASTCGRKVSTEGLSQESGDDKFVIVSDDEKWTILGASLWTHLSKFILNQLNDSSTSYHVVDTSQASDLFLEPDSCFSELARQVLVLYNDTLRKTVTHISFQTVMQFGVFFWLKREGGTSAPFLRWLWDFSQSKSRVSESLDGSLLSSGELLRKICGDSTLMSEILAQLPFKLSELIYYNPVRGWNHLHLGTLEDHERLESYKQEGNFYGSPRARGDKSPSMTSEQSPNFLSSDKREAFAETVPFHNPREIFRRNGELLEALCFNSTEQRQAAVASNKKGISFFDRGDGLPLRDSSDFIWAEADWPQKGWAGTESSPVPTRVSPGIGLGSYRKGLQLGLGGATVGENSQARLESKMSGGGAFGITGYAGIGAAGMGWGVQDDFDNFIDPPATLDNITARALASHPSMPYFLVGSGNTHIYLWEFGKEKAIATYGVLAAANVPPPYALASITGLQFDCRGQRFANSASDGTVSTWQLEVGGRSNVRPTESSICFNGHASDICYVSTSGSIIATAGYSSNGVNVVIWDTLAPPSSSRASVMCHEGGACSISVFDNQVGTGSISPLIVTGGKGGDVGLHDFRYIATGKSKRHRLSHTLDRGIDTAAIDMRSELSSSVGDQNRHGMLWYIPKAHTGSITKISAIPNTSFFLTGSKDGDVKLWDARKASLVYHWPKLHERHTFLQRSSQSFGGVTRAGITDIQVISDGFLSCGGDGSVKLVELSNFPL